MCQQRADYANAAWARYRLGEILMMQGAAAEAEAYFRQALTLPGKDSSIKAFSYERLAHIAYYETRLFKQARQFIDLALAVYRGSNKENWAI